MLHSVVVCVGIWSSITVKCCLELWGLMLMTPNILGFCVLNITDLKAVDIE